MGEPLDDLYLEWLYNQVGDLDGKNPTRSYWNLLRQLYKKEFVWIVPNDDNRIEDGKDLRFEFIDEVGLTEVDPLWVAIGCSVLEMLVALSRRMASEDNGDSRGWFWQLIENLDLRRFNDTYRDAEDEVDDILDRMIWRTYDENGVGGLFPLKDAQKDQRTVELWYQMNAYLLENT